MLKNRKGCCTEIKKEREREREGSAHASITFLKEKLVKEMVGVMGGGVRNGVRDGERASKETWRKGQAKPEEKIVNGGGQCQSGRLPFCLTSATCVSRVLRPRYTHPFVTTLSAPLANVYLNCCAKIIHPPTAADHDFHRALDSDSVWFARSSSIAREFVW